MSIPRAYFHALLFSALLFLSACAGSVAPPVAVQGLAPTLKETMRISEISAETTPGVVMTRAEMDRIVQRVNAEISAQNPNAIIQTNAADASSAAKVKIIFTQYDEGNAAARFVLAGLGQIRIDADVIFVDGSNGQKIGQYQVSKQFALGGLVGGTTRIEDVEKGFAKSVAEILRNQG